MTPESIGTILVAFITGGGAQWLLANAKKKSLISGARLNTAQGKAAEVAMLGDVIDQLNTQREIDKKEMVELQQRVMALETQLHITVGKVIKLEAEIIYYQSVIAEKEEAIAKQARLIEALRERNQCATTTS